MKVFAIILSAIVFWLTLTPCIDEAQDNALQKNELTQQTQNNHHNDGDDACSPFCTCQCCQTTVHIPVIKSTFFASSLKQEYCNIIQLITNYYLFSFYIPPKA